MGRTRSGVRIHRRDTHCLIVVCPIEEVVEGIETQCTCTAICKTVRTRAGQVAQGAGGSKDSLPRGVPDPVGPTERERHRRDRDTGSLCHVVHSRTLGHINSILATSESVCARKGWVDRYGQWVPRSALGCPQSS